MAEALKGNPGSQVLKGITLAKTVKGRTWGKPLQGETWVGAEGKWAGVLKRGKGDKGRVPKAGHFRSTWIRDTKR